MTFEGVLPVVPTPFSENGEDILYDRFAALVEQCIREGAAAIVMFGAGGEFYKLEADEKKRLLAEALRVCGTRVPVIATVTQHATLLAQREAARYQEMGASAINILPPGFAAPSAAMVREHILQLAEATTLPVMVQYAPALTGGVLPATLFFEIAQKLRQELYIKVESTPTGPAVTALRQATDDRFGIIIGNGGECLYEALARGAVAVMPGAAMVKPYCDIMAAWRGGDEQRALSLYNAFLPYLHFAVRHIEEFVAMEKWILMERGIFPNAVCRKPNMEPDAESLRFLRMNYLSMASRFYGTPQKEAER